MNVVVFYADQPGAGKSTCAELLVEAGFKHAALATPLKEMLMTFLMTANITMTQAKRYLYGDQKHVIIPEFGVTGRHLMRTLGTEWGRVMVGPNAWIPALEATLAFYEAKGHNVVIDDVRHRNEATFLSSNYDTTFVKVVRPGHEGCTAHSSEGELRTWPAHVTIVNDGTLDDLKAKVQQYLA